MKEFEEMDYYVLDLTNLLVKANLGCDMVDEGLEN